MAFGTDPTFSYLPQQPETTSFRVTVSYPSGSSTSAPLTITWKPFVPRPVPDSDPTPDSEENSERAPLTVEEKASPGWRVAISTGSSEPEVGEWVTLTAEVTNAPEGRDPGYRWEMRGVGPWRAVGTARSFRYAADAPSSATFRVSVSYATPATSPRTRSP